MSESKPTPEVIRRDRGLALADALLESNRRFQPLPAAAHGRVTRRLRARLYSPAFRRARWLRPVVVAGSLLLWGTAFGIAIDHFVLKHDPSPGPQVQPAAAPDKPRAHRTKARPERPISVEGMHPSAPAISQEIAAPAVEAPAPTAIATTLPPLAALAGARTSRAPGPVARPAPTRVAFTNPSTATVPAARADGESATESTTPPALPAVRPELPAPVPATESLPPAPPPRPPEKTAAPTESLSEERLLAAAVRALRAKQDAASALAALDAYQARYPQGRLSVEASVLRVDALTALHRQPEALRSLDELDLGRMPGGLERRLQRAELRAASGRFREAIADFDGVLAQTRGTDAIERALAGRAKCRQRLGDLAASRADAIEYLRRFPAGPFAQQARDIAKASP
jgi:hypothetical protein